MARRYFRECWAVRPPAPALIVNDFRAVAAGRLAVLHRPAQPVVNTVHIGTRRGREHLPRIRAAFDNLSIVD